MEATIYSTDGKKKGVLKLPESMFGVRWNDDLMHQVVLSMQDNARPPVAHAKTRGEVRGGGKKPWRQKGTGRARHGSIRSPIWRGGGVTHGPRNEKSFKRVIPKKMRAKALFMALSKKAADGELILVDSLQFEVPKTAAAKRVMHVFENAGFKSLATKKRNAALVALAHPTEAAQKSFRNIGSVVCADVRNLNPVSVLRHTYLVLENPEASIALLSGRVPGAKKAATKNS